MGPQPQTSQNAFWHRVGHSVLNAGVATGAWIENRYRSIAPEFRVHLGEASLLSLTLFAPSQTPNYRLPDDGQRLVIFIHGLAGHRGNFIPMQKYFGWCGRTRTVTIGFPDTQSIEVMADHLRQTIAQLVAENELPQEKGIDIVAHSMGGIIARLALQDPKTASKVHTLITMATPHKGTYLARYLNTHKIRALRPSSDLLRQLDCQLPWGTNPNLPPLFCCWTPKDLILLPPQSAIADGAQIQILVEFHGEMPLRVLRDTFGDAHVDSKQQADHSSILSITFDRDKKSSDVTAQALRILLEHEVAIIEVHRGKSLETAYMELTS